MTIQTNTPDRKTLVKAIAEELGTEYRYMGMPTCNYEVGSFIIDRNGNIIGDDFTALRSFLLRHDYITEDTDIATEDSEADATEETTDETIEAEPEAKNDSEEEQPAEAAETTEDAETGIDQQTITIPAPDITTAQLRNLTFTLYSRQYILNLMTGGETIHIPDALIDALKEALPATLEDFTALLDSHRDKGLEGFDFREGQFSMTFPFYEMEPTKWTTFAGLQGRILQAAMAATRVFPEILKPEEEAEKYTAHMWLQRLGYKGAEMKEQRNLLLKHLHGYCAFSNGAKMQNHKDKYSAIRRERREAERAQAAEAIAEHATTTTEHTETATAEAKSPAVDAAKEVLVND